MKKAFILALCMMVAAAGFFFNMRNEVAEAAYTPVEESPLYESPLYESIFPLTPIPRNMLTDTGYLKLVNRELAMATPTADTNIVSAWPTIPVRTMDITLHSTALSAVSALLAESCDTWEFFISSGHRSHALQRELYENATNRAYVLPPGHSEHELGLAADILVMGIPMSEMSGSAQMLWLTENAWQHGLILRYPQGMEHITGVAYEPWHFRYVGRVHAWYMYQNRMVLEQYLEYLKEHGRLNISFDGVEYHVMYTQLADGNLHIPNGMQFNISVSNRGGYVVTAWAS